MNVVTTTMESRKREKLLPWGYQKSPNQPRSRDKFFLKMKASNLPLSNNSLFNYDEVSANEQRRSGFPYLVQFTRSLTIKTQSTSPKSLFSNTRNPPFFSGSTTSTHQQLFEFDYANDSSPASLPGTMITGAHLQLWKQYSLTLP